MEQLLLQHPTGLRQADLARILGVHRSTVSRLVPALTELFPIVEEDDGRLTIDRSRYLSRMKITLDEAMAIYLGARLLYRHSDLQNPHVESAVFKLADAIHGVAPHLADDVAATARSMSDDSSSKSAAYIRALEALTRALAERRWVTVRYQPLTAPKPTTARFAPYLLEPYGPGFSTYAIGLRDPPVRVFTLKVERMVNVRLEPETFEVPANHDHAELLRNTWGIWRPDEDGPVEVVLRFSAAVAARVRESRWHKSETIQSDDAGGVIWRGVVGDVLEISPWIRGWGKEVEVLAPAALRESIADDARAAAAQYR
jgi:predicted DNA-binding transcriptional regulator YafY